MVFKSEHHFPASQKSPLRLDPEVEDFMKACEENADAQRVADYNAGSLAGVSPVQLCTDGTGEKRWWISGFL